jgi:hypothetical protein
MSDKQTVSEFIEQSDLIKRQISDSLKMVSELKTELENTRVTLEHLKIFSPNEVFTHTQPYHLRKENIESERNVPMALIINKQIIRINTLLGDKR